MNEQLQLLARRQHGLVTTQQFELHASRQLLRTLVKRGVLIRARRSVYKITGAPETWEQAMLAALLAGPNGTIASHRAAGRLWNMRYCDGAQVEVTVPVTASVRIGEARIHQSVVPEWQRTTRNGIDVMTVPRTIISLSSVLNVSRLGKVVDQCIYDRLVSARQVYDTLLEIGTRGRGKSSLLRPLLEDRLGMGLVQSELETRTAKALLAAGVTDFETQHAVYVPGRAEPFHIDFAWPERRVGLEPQGFAFHDGRRSTFDSDRVRLNALTALGWRLFFVTSNTPIDDVVEDVRRVLR